MHRHEQLHRRQGRDAFPDPKAIAEAIADAFPNPFAKAEPQRTVVSVVYITASPTFDGPIGGYRTLGAGESLDDNKKDDDDDDDDDKKKTTRTTQAKTTVQPEITTTRQPEPSKQPTKEIVADTSAPAPAPVTTKAKQTTFETSTSNLPSEIIKPTAALTSSAAVVAASGTPTRSNVFSRTSAVNLQAEATESAKPVETGMSTGGKAGLAIGILLIIGAILALVLFVFKRRKQKAKEQAADNEKSAMAFVAAGRPASQRTNPKAPRLSLRPVTQFLPNLGEKRASRGNALQAAAAVAPQQRQQTAPENNRNNPFSDAKAIDPVNAQGASPVQINGPSGEILVAAAATGVGAGLARGASKRGDKPKDFTTKGGFMAPGSPNGTEFSQSSEATGTTPGPTTSGAAIAAAGGPPNSAVHRVQLDFKPSMEDELELRAGQLIRLLHEYDDGWALCIRLDRSQQGVVPRTCLSTRPVKPRPQQPGQTPRGSPPGQRGPQGQMRPMSPAMNGQQRGSPNMSQGSRPSSPADGRYSPAPGQRPMTPQGQQQRPMTPQGQQRPMTPQGQGRPRSPSVAQQQGRRQSPPGPSRMNPGPPTQELSSSPPSVGRKPVPGQAL